MEAQASEGLAEQEYSPLSEQFMQLFVKQAHAIEEKFRETLEENSDLKELANLKATQLNELSARLEGKERELEGKDFQLKERCEEVIKKDREIERLRETVDQQDIQLRKTTLECLESSREMNFKQRKIEELTETVRIDL
uniref:Uncharacterized protein n=1 Tax=Amphimedon queenslandica TaxID=400682 RepID=A0A1X7VHT0_AMPQE